jgi:hypothetical protein
MELGPGVAADLDRLPGDNDGSGRLAIPGLASTHFHSPGTFMKGAIPDLPLALYMLFEVPSMTSVVTPDDDAFFLPAVTDEEVDGVKAVTHVIVGGKTVVEDGHLLTIDEQSLVDGIIDLSGEIEAFATSCTAGARELLQFYDAAYRHGQATSASPTYTAGRSRIPAGPHPNEENQ